jgi:hypothetical protein
MHALLVISIRIAIDFVYVDLHVIVCSQDGPGQFSDTLSLYRQRIVENRTLHCVLVLDAGPYAIFFVQQLFQKDSTDWFQRFWWSQGHS